MCNGCATHMQRMCNGCVTGVAAASQVIARSPEPFLMPDQAFEIKGQVSISFASPAPDRKSTLRPPPPLLVCTLLRVSERK